MIGRVLMFVAVGAFVAWLGRLAGAPSSLWVVQFVLGGLGAVAAIDVFAWWVARRASHSTKAPPRRNRFHF